MSDADDKIIDKIEKVSSATKSVSVGPAEEIQRVAPNKDYFESLMNQGQKVGAEQAAIDSVSATDKPSLMDEVRKLNNQMETFNHSTPEAIKVQAQDVIAQIDSIKEQLTDPNLKLKGSVQNLLQNKLSHIDDNLRIALSKAGVEYVPQEKPVGVINPIERFIGYLTHGQYQLEHLHHTIEQLQITKEELTPANMLAIQIKVTYIQQELEFFTSLLGKTLESVKTMMNVQV